MPSWVFDPTANSGDVGVIECFDRDIGDLLCHPSGETKWQEWSSRCRFRSASHDKAVASFAGVVSGSRVRLVGSAFKDSKVEDLFHYPKIHNYPCYGHATNSQV